MRKTFNPEKKKNLSSRWRQRMLPPYETLKRLGIKSSDTVADIGCGTGYFSIPASEYVDDNPVYALDISVEMLNELRNRSQTKKIITVNTEPYDFKIDDNSITFALLVSVLHEIDDTGRFINEIKRVLKKDGRLAIVEWHKTTLDFGPILEHKISPDEVNHLFKEHFNLIDNFNFNDYFYGCVLVVK